MLVNFYSCSDDMRKVNKQLNAIKESLECKIKDECSLEAPYLLLHKSSLTNISRTNYCYIGDFGRYYYIKNINTLKGQLIEVSCICDVLMSFRNEIRALSGMILRQESITNPFIVDEKLPVRTNRIISYKYVGDLGNSNGIALTVNAG